jgi:NAD(P)-dependent dehydrogenase (short-subunit alcohol dehydrogenase family)
LQTKNQTYALAKDLAARGNVLGIVKNVGAARHETIDAVDYAGAKAALESLTRTMATELAADGITANAIAHGPTETELFRANNPLGSEGEARYLKGGPMGRFAQPAEMAAAIAFLAGGVAAFVTADAVCGWRCKPRASLGLLGHLKDHRLLET